MSPRVGPREEPCAVADPPERFTSALARCCRTCGAGPPPCGRRPRGKSPPAGPWPEAWVAGTHLGAAGGRSYDVYVPAGLRRRTAAPLVVLLHGCGQTPASSPTRRGSSRPPTATASCSCCPTSTTRHHPLAVLALVRGRAPAAREGEPAVSPGSLRRSPRRSSVARGPAPRSTWPGCPPGWAMALTWSPRPTRTSSPPSGCTPPRAYRSCDRPARRSPRWRADGGSPAEPRARRAAAAIVVQGGAGLRGAGAATGIASPTSGSRTGRRRRRRPLRPQPLRHRAHDGRPGLSRAALVTPARPQGAGSTGSSTGWGTPGPAGARTGRSAIPAVPVRPR
jgi:hypothetical protein